MNSDTMFTDLLLGRSGNTSLGDWGILLGGGALALATARRSPKAGTAMLAAGGMYLYLRSKRAETQKEFSVDASILINCASAEAYRTWRDLEGLPSFMNHIARVEQLDDRRSEWVVSGPFGTRVQWRSEISSELPDQFIRWRSTPGGPMEMQGSVEFLPAPGGRGTYVKIEMRFRPNAAGAGKVLLQTLGKNADFLLRQDLRRLKALIETGEIPTIEGQSHGPRTVLATMARIADPDKMQSRGSSINEVFDFKRRAS